MSLLFVVGCGRAAAPAESATPCPAIQVSSAERRCIAAAASFPATAVPEGGTSLWHAPGQMSSGGAAVPPTSC